MKQNKPAFFPSPTPLDSYVSILMGPVRGGSRALFYSEKTEIVTRAMFLSISLPVIYFSNKAGGRIQRKNSVWMCRPMSSRPFRRWAGGARGAFHWMTDYVGLHMWRIHAESELQPAHCSPECSTGPRMSTL